VAEIIFLLTISSWNIHGGKYWTQVHDEFQKNIAPFSDVVTLQETLTEPGQEQAQRLGAEFGFEVHFAGHDAILSKLPIRDRGALITNPDTGRVTPWVEIEWNREPLLIYSPHLSYKVSTSPLISKIRRGEMARIIEHSRGRRAIIAGDLNTVESGWFGTGELSVPLAKNAGFLDALSTDAGFTHMLLGRLDWILARGFRVRTSKRGEYGGSDHRWLQTRLR
jgi:endonuclease/exonuclease/phosphatase (EEP) superfamily protein YafD